MRNLILVSVLVCMCGCASVEVVRTGRAMPGDVVCVESFKGKDDAVNRILADAITMELSRSGYSISCEKPNVVITGSVWLTNRTDYALMGSAYSGGGTLYGGGASIFYINSVTVNVKDTNNNLLASASYNCQHEIWNKDQTAAAIGKKLGRKLAADIKN